MSLLSGSCRRSPHSVGAVWSAARRPFTTRDARRRLERLLCDMYGAREALLVGSGTVALPLALKGRRRWHPGGRWRSRPTPATTWHRRQMGAGVEVLLYDLDPHTLGPEETSLRRALEREPAAVVVAHLYGYPVDLESVSRLAHGAGTLLIEDAAQGAGGRLRGVALGSLGSLTVLSFGRGKGTTAGAGGALLARDETREPGCWRGRPASSDATEGAGRGLLAAQWMFGRPALYGIPASIPALRLGETVYHPPRPPSAMSAAAIGALPAALRAADADVEHRRVVAERLAVVARAGGRVRVVEPVEGAAPGYLRFPLLPLVGRKAVLDVLAERGVASGYPRPLEELGPSRTGCGTAPMHSPEPGPWRMIS